MDSESRDDPAIRGSGPTARTHRPSQPSQVWTIATALAREEWRLHARLFGGRRFLAIPVVLGAFAIGTALALTETGTSAGGVVLGLHVFAVGFGLYAGTAGFAGSDMIEDVFGPHSFLLGTTPSLPVSRRLFLGLFLLKDAVVYGLFFVGPMAFAFVGLEGLSSGTAGVVAVQWLSLWLAFVFGMVVTVGAISMSTRGVHSWAFALVVGLIGLGLWTTGSLLDAVAFVTTGSSPIAAGGLALVTIVMGVLSLAVYNPEHSPPARTTPGRYDRLRTILPGADPLVAKSILDLGRSSGGYAKPFVSTGILLVLVGGLVAVVESITGVAPAPGIFFGAVLGLGAFTTYNWLTQFDDVDAYRIHPISVADLFEAKRLSFVLVGAPTLGLPYTVAVVWFDATLLDAIAGAAVLAGYSLYYYGLTVTLAGFAPNEFLFDGLRFGAFGAGVALVLLPTLVCAFVLVSPGRFLTGMLVVGSLALAVVGVALTRLAADYWGDRYLDGTVR